MPTARVRRLAALLLTSLTFLTVGVAAGQAACRAELLDAVGDRSLDTTPTGGDAARLLARAVELVEPALPALVTSDTLPVPEDYPYGEAVKYLLERQLLPGNWTQGELEGNAWAEMLSAFLAWYELPAVQAPPPATIKEAVDTVAAVLADVSRAVRPAALLATDPRGGSRATFFAIIWNWTVYPRLLVVRPEEGEASDPKSVMNRLSNCAVRVTAYISAPEGVATRLFLAHNASRMFVVGSRPENAGAWPLEVPEGREITAFNYTMPELEAVDLYAAVFDGPSVGVGTLLGMLPRIRTNISPLNLARYLETP